MHLIKVSDKHLPIIAKYKKLHETNYIFGSNRLHKFPTVEEWFKHINQPDLFQDEGWVDNIQFILVDNKATEVIGMSVLRLKLNAYLTQNVGHIGYSISPIHHNKNYGTLLLNLTLQQAYAHNIDNVLLVCSELNIASAKVIEKNGGVLENCTETSWGEKIKRYRIKCPK